MFSDGALYSGLRWFWLLGAVAPVFTWFFARKYPFSIWRYVHVPLILGGSGFLPPATTYIYLYVAPLTDPRVSLSQGSRAHVFVQMLGPRWRDIQRVYQTPLESLVVAVQLHHQRGARLRAHHLDHCSVLRSLFYRGFAAGMVRQRGRFWDSRYGEHGGDVGLAAGGDVRAKYLALGQPL